ncbi:hypothetical protein, partial [Rhizobium leguminosarum]|uniref:hypothetical protein n=1 Tax=Rhizobium leguminosarum TaxID=384 RepID=UPI001A908FA1
AGDPVKNICKKACKWEPSTYGIGSHTDLTLKQPNLRPSPDAYSLSVAALSCHDHVSDRLKARRAKASRKSNSFDRAVAPFSRPSSMD